MGESKKSAKTNKATDGINSTAQYIPAVIFDKKAR